jgi:predicted DNA repair protein MutK
MSGLLALLDDVAAIAKLAATQLDDVAAQASKAGMKAAGVVIDDAAVTPKYVTGLPAARELPIVWKIARASFFNKLVILLPVALLLQAFAPWMLTPLLMIGGAYLCFEGAEKVWHIFVPHKEHGPQQAKTLDAAHLEEQRVKGAIKTDFILSAEIMTISLSQINTDTLWIQATALGAVAIGITSLVYGAVALLVKADDFGIMLSAKGRLAATRAVGHRIVKSMPAVMVFIATIGTVAMLWVGGSIIVHGIRDLGWYLPYETIKHAATVTAAFVGSAEGFVTWFITAGLDGIIGLAAGFVLIPVVNKLIAPTMAWLFPEKT